MIGHQDKSAGWRGSREGWLAAARQALLAGGVDAVKIQPLAQQLQISRTSFYWFFKDRDDLLNALLAAWEAKNTGAFVQACGGYADSIAEAVLSLIAMFYSKEKFEPQLDFAVRSWAHQSAHVTARVHQADEARLAAICNMFQRFGYAPALADVRARTVYLTQIGYISMQVQESMELRLSRVPAYVETFCGRPPTKAEMARFYAQLP